jgi:hypothetical protein
MNGVIRRWPRPSRIGCAFGFQTVASNVGANFA